MPDSPVNSLVAGIRKQDRKQRIRVGFLLFVIGVLVLALTTVGLIYVYYREDHDRTNIGTIQQVLHQEASCPQHGYTSKKCSALLLREVKALTPADRAQIRVLFTP